MTATTDQLRADLLALPEADRLELAHILFDSVEHPSTDEEVAFEAELARRHAEVVAGKATLIPAEEAFRQVREALAAQREQ